MSSQSPSSPVFFADTGVQIACYPLEADLQFPAEQVGSGWQPCRCKVQDEIVQYGYLQWQLLRQKLFLAIDTTVGSDDAELGYFAKSSTLSGEFFGSVTGLLGRNGTPLARIPPLEFTIRPATAEGGEPRDVHLVIDFGNSRTGALLVEFRGDTAQEPLMTPLQLINRYQLDAWDAGPIATPGQGGWWFSSRSHWCTPPYVQPPQLEKLEYRERKTRKIFGERVEQVSVTTMVTPRTFEDFSMVRLGHEADDLAGVIHVEGESRTGVSSPKRYLWAKDDSWLEGANWYMADPFDRYDDQHHATLLKGPLLRYFPEDDAPDDPKPEHEEAPPRPRHAPRTLMIGALYELLCQAHGYMNSPVYRHLTGDVGRMRLLRSMTLTYPSGIIQPERLWLQKQARKAIAIFEQTLGKNQPRPELKLSVDEASAVHLTYIWSEVQKLGRKPGLWFSVMGHRQPEKPSEEAAETLPTEPQRHVAARPVRAGRRPRSSDGDRAGAMAQSGPELRIACIDIGGGTTDLMIARYTCKIGAGGDLIEGETLHRDGISLAGDHLVKRLLERIIVPEFVNVVGIETADAQRLFGKEVPSNRAFRAQRVHWINRLFVPLAQAYLENAVNEVEDKITHNAATVSPEVVQSLQNTINSVWGPGTYNVKQNLGICYDRGEFEDVVDEVFGDLLFDLCESIVAYKADVVLLAGLPSKLRTIRHLVETYLPLPPSRIIPMYGRYVGTWYPYQNPDNLNPGVIVDPKSTVVVGAAVEFLARHGMLSQFNFRMTDLAAKQSYYWGVMTESRIDKERILFEPRSEGDTSNTMQRTELSLSAQHLVIGRKRRKRENAQASPVYLLKVLRGSRLGEVDVKVAIERHINDVGEEELSLEAVEGTVDGSPAVLRRNVLLEWRTLADERYYLDTGGLDKLEIG